MDLIIYLSSINYPSELIPPIINDAHINYYLTVLLQNYPPVKPKHISQLLVAIGKLSLPQCQFMLPYITNDMLNSVQLDEAIKFIVANPDMLKRLGTMESIFETTCGIAITMTDDDIYVVLKDIIDKFGTDDVWDKINGMVPIKFLPKWRIDAQLKLIVLIIQLNVTYKNAAILTHS